MPSIFVLYKAEIQPEYVDNSGCFTLLGRRPIGSDPQTPFTFPVTITVDGFTSTYFSETTFWAGVNIESPSDQELSFRYGCGECTPPCECDDPVIVNFEFIDCTVPCPDVIVTITVTNCDFSIVSVVPPISNPAYQWQIDDAGVWVDVAGETGTTFTGQHTQTYRLQITNLDDGCVYWSQPLTANCPPPACVTTITSFTYNETLQQFEFSWSNTNGAGLVNWVLYGFTNPTFGNCCNSQGSFVIGSDSNVAGTSAIFPYPQTPNPACYRLFIFDDGDPNCSDLECYEDTTGAGCQGNVTIETSGASCSYQGIAFEDCNVPNGNLIQMQLVANALAPSYCIDFEYSNSCGENFFGTTNVQMTGFTYREMYLQHTIKNVETLHISSLPVSATIGGTVNLSFDPSLPNSLNYVSGAGGTLANVWKMAFNTVNGLGSATIAEWQTNMRIALINALEYEFGAVIASNYAGITQLPAGLLTIVETVDQDFTPFANIRINFRNKHNPTGLWLGFTPSAIGDIGAVTGQTPATVANTLLDTWVNNPQATNQLTIDCGSVSMTVATTNTFAPLPATQFDNIVINNPATFGILSAPVLNCGGSTILTAQTTGIPNPSFLWSTGETTQSIVCTTGTIYWLVVTGSDGCEYDVENITCT